MAGVCICVIGDYVAVNFKKKPVEVSNNHTFSRSFWIGWCSGNAMYWLIVMLSYRYIFSPSLGVSFIEWMVFFTLQSLGLSLIWRRVSKVLLVMLLRFSFALAYLLARLLMGVSHKVDFVIAFSVLYFAFLLFEVLLFLQTFGGEGIGNRTMKK